jgi:hypothetical protein
LEAGPRGSKSNPTQLVGICRKKLSGVTAQPGSKKPDQIEGIEVPTSFFGQERHQQSDTHDRDIQKNDDTKLNSMVAMVVPGRSRCQVAAKFGSSGGREP